MRRRIADVLFPCLVAGVLSLATACTEELTPAQPPVVVAAAPTSPAAPELPIPCEAAKENGIVDTGDQGAVTVHVANDRTLDTVVRCNGDVQSLRLRVTAGSLTRLGELPELTNLEVDVPSLDAIPELPKLKRLHVSITSTSLPTLPDMPNARALSISRGRSVTSIELEALARFANLESLTLSGTVASTKALSRMPRLQDVHLRGVGDLAILEDAPALVRFSAELADGAPEPSTIHAPKLSALGLANVRDLSFLKQVPSLTAVNLRVQAKAELGPLAALPKLAELTVEAPQNIPAAQRPDLKRLRKAKLGSLTLRGCFRNISDVVGRVKHQVMVPPDSIENLEELLGSQSVAHGYTGVACSTLRQGD